MPAWVTACSNVPYLLCDGSVYNVSAFPSLGAKLLGKFGGNGINTFAVPDSQGRIQLPYDGTGTRITAPVSGINGQTIGAAGGDQAMQAHSHANTLTDPGHTHSHNANAAFQGGGPGPDGNINPPQVAATINAALTGITIHNASTGAGASQNVQPSQVTGIMVIRAG